jgi:hypothetical protein
MNSIPGHKGDNRTLDKLFNGINVTTDDKNMWLIPYTCGQFHKIWINLGKRHKIQRILIYNYNKNIDDVTRGVKRMTISIDGKLITPRNGFLIRMSTGNDKVDYSQSITSEYGWEQKEIGEYKTQVTPPSAEVKQEYETPLLPMGTLLQFNLLSTYGDPFFLGLNGIEIFDSLGKSVLQPGRFKIYSYPSSIKVLPGMENDIRTVDKLIDHVNLTKDDRHMWLAPYSNMRIFALANRDAAPNPNCIYILFDQPVAISCIILYNYTKTPKRGVNEFEILFDHKLIYKVIV